jgi:hypothetical protein
MSTQFIARVTENQFLSEKVRKGVLPIIILVRAAIN